MSSESEEEPLSPLLLESSDEEDLLSLSLLLLLLELISFFCFLPPPSCVPSPSSRDRFPFCVWREKELASGSAPNELALGLENRIALSLFLSGASRLTLKPSNTLVRSVLTASTPSRDFLASFCKHTRHSTTIETTKRKRWTDRRPAQTKR